VGKRDSACSPILTALFKNRTKHYRQASITLASNPGGAKSKPDSGGD
jgi:hypothetical protein